MAGDEIEIDHAFIPFRDLAAAAGRRIQVHEQAAASGEPPFPGRDGMWRTGGPGEQELVLGRQFFRLVTALGDAGIPMTFIGTRGSSTTRRICMSASTQFFPTSTSRPSAAPSRSWSARTG